MDFIITNSRIMDPLSKKPLLASVAVVDDRINRRTRGVSSIPLDRFDRVIDAGGSSYCQVFLMFMQGRSFLDI
jgi:adenine deaminase